MRGTTKHLSISFRSDNGCIEHNNRAFFTDNVDRSRTGDNITYVKKDLLNTTKSKHALIE